MYDATGVIGLKYDNNTYLFEKNLQGDIIGIIDSSNERAATYEYDAWGKVLSIKDKDGNEVSREDHVGVINPFRYRGYYYDAETGLYYLNSRYYNPEWCRFINADGVIGANTDILSFNLYAYVSNNPVMFIDSLGDIAGVIFGLELTKDTLIALGLISAVPVAPSLMDSMIQFGREIVECATDVIQNALPKRDKKKANDDNGHNVYVLRNEAGKAEYVGRTTDLGATKRRHKKNPARKDLDLDPVARGISKNAARGLEEALILQCQTLNRNTEYRRNNQIHGLREGHKNFKIYWDSAQTWLSENVVSCDSW